MNDLGMQDIYTLQIKRHKRSNDIISPNCEACQKGFLHINSLQVREFTQTGKLPGVCKSCNTTFLKICRIQIRNMTQTDQQPHICDFCGKTFTHAGNYLKHKRLHENEVKMEENENEVLIQDSIQDTPMPDTPVSDNPISSTPNLNAPIPSTPIANNRPTPPFTCEKCGKVFMKYGSFRNHVEGHENSENLKCPICDRTCSTKNTFDKHVIHCQNRQAVYVCQYCETTFNTKSNLKTHLEMHVLPPKQEEHVCKFCKQTYLVAEELETHLLQHLHDNGKEEESEDQKEKFNHFCVECQKGFIHLGTLRNHMQTHSGNLPFQCKTCKKQFVHSGRLKKHMKLHSLKWPFECKVCAKRFKNLKSMKKHRASHNK